MPIFWSIIFLIGAFAILRMWSRHRDDAETMAYATRKEPIILISEHAFDGAVESRADEIRKCLRESGNQYLKGEPGYGVCVYVYRVHFTLLNPIESIEMEHSIWYDNAIREAASRKEQWRKQKIGWVGDNAGQIFAGQKPSAN